MFYECKVPKEKCEHIISDKFTAAEVYVPGILSICAHNSNRYQICFQSPSMEVAISQLIDTTAKDTLSLSTQLAKSQKKPKKKRRAISGASSSEEEEVHTHGHKKKYLAKSVNLSFNHF